MNLLYTLKTVDKAAISIFDVTGKLIYKNDITNENTRIEINLSNLKEGMYYFKIENGNKTLKADKLIIMK